MEYNEIIKDRFDTMEIESCLVYYRNFKIDFYALMNAGVLQYIGINRYDWKRKKTSLAEYFDWIGKDDANIPRGFWGHIAKVFTIKGKPTTGTQLSHLLNKQKNIIKLPSDEFLEIQEIVKKHRNEVQNAEEAHKHLSDIHEIIHVYFDMPHYEQKSPVTINNLLDRLKSEIKKVDINFHKRQI